MVEQEWTVARHLEGRPDAVVALYHRFIELVVQCRPFSYAVSKSAITVKGPRRGFAGANLGQHALRGYFDLTDQGIDPRIARCTPYAARLYVHQLRVADLSELDGRFAGWLREAYRVGCGEHLLGPPRRA